MAFSLDSHRNRRFGWLLVLGIATTVLLAARTGWGQTQGRSQAPKAGSGASKGGQAQPLEPADTTTDGPTNDAAAEALVVEKLQWPEPRRRELLRNEFKEISTTLVLDRERAAILEMSKGQGSIDSALIRKYVASNAAELTRHTNIAAMLGDAGAVRNQRSMDEASSRLLQPLLESANANNAAFRREYVKALKDMAPQLLEGHLLTRTFYMVVLSRSGADELVPVFIDQLQDPQQTYVVKLLAAVGLTKVAQDGRRPPDATSRAIPAAKAVADFLRVAPRDAPWPVICRNLETLAAMRQATENPLSGKAEIADVAFDLLSREDVEPEVRVWAGWALSRIQYPGSIRDLNFDLVATLLGETAADLAEQAAAIPLKGETVSRNQRLVAKIAEDLFRILGAFSGSSDVRGSGLGTLSRESPVVRGIEQRIRAVASDCLQLTQAAGSQIEPARKTLAEAAVMLREFLSQNPPKSRAFYAGGPELAVPEEAPAETPGVATGAR